MNGRTPRGSRVTADAELRARLERLTAPLKQEIDQDRANALLARVVWARLAEPGDATAGALVAALGPGPALDLVAGGAGVRRIGEAVRQAGASVSMRALKEGAARWLPRLDRGATVSDLDRAISGDILILDPDSAAWPESLAHLGDHAPHLLWVRGDPAALSSPALAVVGARACTAYGSHVTAELTDAACAAGAAIISGGAYGIDAVAHRAALASESTTVAVVAGGVDRPYPAAHTELFGRIAAYGAVCSEMVPGAAPTRWRFLQRNRLIAALSHATLVTEAGARSGSLNTAGHTAELGRPLGAVPGPVTSATSTGCHRLIRDYGAALVTNGAEVRELLGIGETALLDHGENTGDSTDRQPALHRRVIDGLPLRGSRELIEVARRAGLSPEETRGALAELALLGAVEQVEAPGGSEARWRLLKRQ